MVGRVAATAWNVAMYPTQIQVFGEAKSRVGNENEMEGHHSRKPCANPLRSTHYRNG